MVASFKTFSICAGDDDSRAHALNLKREMENEVYVL